MGHRPVLGLVKHVVSAFQARLQVVRVEDGHLGAFRQARLAEHLDVGVGDLGNQRTAKRRSADGVDGRVRAHGHHVMTGQERHEVRRHANGAHSGSATPVRNREGLVQVEVTDVRANHAWAGQPHLGIHVGAVHVHLAAVGVNQLRHFEHRGFKHPVCGGVRDHEGTEVGAVRFGFGPEVVDVDVAVLVTSDHHHLHARHHGTGRVGPVGAVGDEANVPVRLPA